MSQQRVSIADPLSHSVRDVAFLDGLLGPGVIGLLHVQV